MLLYTMKNRRQKLASCSHKFHWPLYTPPPRLRIQCSLCKAWNLIIVKEVPLCFNSAVSKSCCVLLIVTLSAISVLKAAYDVLCQLCIH